MIKVVVRGSDIIDICVFLRHTSLLFEVAECRQVGNLFHGDLGNATSRFVSDVDSCEIFYFSIVSVTPQESMQVDLALLQPDRVVQLADVTRSSKDTSSEPQ